MFVCSYLKTRHKALPGPKQGNAKERIHLFLSLKFIGKNEKKRNDRMKSIKAII